MNFLFDIGNVIVSFDFISALNSLIPDDDTSREARIHAVLERKDEFEAGRIGPEEYFPWAMKILDFKGSEETFLSTWNDIFTPNQAMWDCIEGLSNEDHKLYLFSNIQSDHKRFLLHNHAVFRKFSGGIFSYKTGYVKPEQAIYEIAISQYKLIPEKTIYIDDLAANIEAGKNLGFICYQYDIDQHDAFTEWLQTKLLELA
ncbi:MAG: HAD family hydrolase [Akkermansiaceae bacterium]